MDFAAIVGMTFKSVEETEMPDTSDAIVFTAVDGRKYRQFHQQDCCENVRVEEIVGDLSDLVGSPILAAEETSNENLGDATHDTSTWTFYRVSTIKGTVVIRWLGESNGYYSESVYFEEAR